MIKVTLSDVGHLCRNIGSFLKKLATALRTEKVWAYSLMLFIPVAILTDVYIQHHGAPIEYARAEEIATTTPVQIVVKVDWSRERIDKEIEALSEEYNVSAATMKRVVNCESRYNTKALGDGGKSRGLVQIHSGYHPTVSDEMAYDPEYALEFLAKALAQDQGRLWSCYRMH